MSENDEVIILVDKNNRVIGDVPRRLMNFGKDYHRVTYILVFNQKGNLLVQKRTDNKAFCPGYYGITTGGVVEKDESYIDSAHRELQEELGFDAPLESQGVFLTEGEGFKIWGKIYTCHYDSAQHGELNLQPKEVASIHEMSINSISDNKDKLLFTPDSFAALQHYTDLLTHPKADDPL
ncbi:NUDIX domain-containing protein [Marinomonas sp. M1K-6]|uniref:NUDIX domain-containing protein n=1 Tax=Marinomonas profundi TaxID=2726122 RepID=A0A847RDK8_9GAMM|nr:NUDIX domain-containing protein [Marinomonas profundi]NLQ18300.1 NUDIX domain-containing protein [Marinomonas profundi]UDV02363.1 NUDIX domain-containing protein [Marinomonas profundi]